MVRKVSEFQGNTPIFSGVIWVSMVLTMLFATLAQAQDDQVGPVQSVVQAEGVPLDRIVAIVNDGIVLQSQLNRQTATIVARLAGQDVQLPPQDVLERQILERLVVEELQLQRADNLGLKVSDDVVNVAVASIAERNNVQLEHLPAILETQGIDYIAYRDDLRRELVLEQLRSRDLVSRISVTREEAQKFLDSKAADDNSEYEISQILIALSGDASPEETAESAKKVQEIYEKLENGESFGSMAVSYSDGQQALNGGKIGWRKRQELPTLFAEAVSKLAPGSFSEPIRSGSGFHIVKLDQKRGEEDRKVIVTEYRARHILVETNELRTASDAEGKALTLRDRLVGGADFGELAKNNSDDLGTANDGGNLGWAGPGAFVPQFEAALKQLQPGEISQPIKTQFGYHLIETLESRQQDKTTESRLNEAANLIRTRKAQEETESWLLRMRDEAYVDYRL